MAKINKRAQVYSIILAFKEIYQNEITSYFRTLYMQKP